MEYDIKRFVRVDKDAKQNLPSEMLQAKAWLVWEAVPQDGKKPKKVPKYANGANRSGTQGSESDLEQLCTFDEAMDARARLGSDRHGIGFALLPDSKIVCLDFDNAYTEDGARNENGVILEEIYNSIGSYAQCSASETGGHIFVKGNATPLRGGPIEIFTGSQFICMTCETIVYGERMPKLRAMDDSFFVDVAAQAARLKGEPTPQKSAEPAQFINQDVFDSALLDEALRSISSDDYHAWVRVGMAIKSRFGDAGLDNWKQWSAQSHKYNERETARKWQSFKRSGVNFGSIIAESKVDPKAFFREWAQKNRQYEGVDQYVKKIEADVIDSIWPDPVPLMESNLPPKCDLSILPRAMSNFVREQSEIIGCDQGVLIVSSICAAAGAIDDGIKLQPKRYDMSWKERACIWAAFVGDPSQKKSPAMNMAMKPLAAIDRKYRLNYDEALSDYLAKKERWSHLSQKEKRENPFDCEEPIRSAVIANDTTIEAFADMLKGNPRGIIAVHDELGGWFGAMDAYNSGSGGSKDRPKWLELYNGGFKSIDRAKSVTCVPNWSASLLGGIQPDSIRDYLRKIPKDGLIQRFMIVCQSGGSRAGKDRRPEPGVTAEYHKMIEWLFGLHDQYIFKLSDGAIMVRESIEREKIALIESGGLPDGCAAFVGKMEGLFCRLLLIWHLCENYGCDVPPEYVDESTAIRARDFVLDYLLPHSIYFYGVVLGGASPDSLPMQTAARVLVNDSDVITNRDLVAGCRQWREAQPWERKKAVEYLESCAWIKPRVDGRNEVVKWDVSPKLKRDFGRDIAAEKERRRMATERIRQAKSSKH